MANATVSRLGQVDLAGDAKAIFLKVFAGEVLTAFETMVIMKEKTRQRTISSGKSASFPATFQASGGYHTPGAEILGNPIAHNEVIIAIDDLLLSDVFIANIDEAMNHYDVRGPYSTEMGRFLAKQYDANVARNVVRAARGGALFTGDTGGSQIIDADGRTSATSLAGSIWAAKQALEERDVPVDTMTVEATFKPAQWYLLAQEPTLILNRDVDGDGSYSKGQFSMIGGVQVSKSNNLPWGTDDSANTALPTDYRIDMTNTVGTVFVESAAATVQLMGLAMESEYDIRRQGTLMVGKYAVGHGPLRNKSAVEITVA
jgi:hypothetical protein